MTTAYWPLIKYLYMISIVIGFMLAFGLLLANLNAEIVPPQPSDPVTNAQSEATTVSSVDLTTKETWATVTELPKTTPRDLSGYGRECTYYYTPCTIEECTVYFFASNYECTIHCSHKQEADPGYTSAVIQDLLKISVSRPGIEFLILFSFLSSFIRLSGMQQIQAVLQQLLPSTAK